MKTLVIAEKPSVGKDIARVLKAGKGGQGYMEGPGYIVTWALGHLVTLAEPEKYNEKYKKWDLDHLPILPERTQLVVIPQTSKQYRTAKDLIHRKDVNEIVIATDAGREGELVARWILEKAGNKKPLKRLWISSVTDKAIREGFQKLKDGKAYINLYYSAQARAEADWFVGINATRALTAKYNAQLSCGRVQTPTLAMIAQREDERRSFKPVPYYKVVAYGGGVRYTWQNPKSHDFKTFSKEEAENVLQDLKTTKAKVAQLEKKPKKQYAPGLYDLTLLQREANSAYGFSAKETLSILQNLYERHKVLTYPRTDSRFLSADIVPTIPERLQALSKGGFARQVQPVLKKPVKAHASFVDDKKVSDHHAIIPTEETPYLDDFTDKEKKIYQMVVKRFLAVLYPPYEYEQMTVTVAAGSHRFQAKGKRVLQKGYQEIYEKAVDDEEELEDQNLPVVKNGEEFSFTNGKLEKEMTKPPALFTEGTLLAAMENPVQYMQNKDKSLAKTLGETGGLGTVATRADIIEKLFSSFFAEKNGSSIQITSKGRQLLSLAPEELKSPDLTARWETQLTGIAKGNAQKTVFLQEVKQYTRKVIDEIKSSQAQFRHDNVTGHKCPECGKLLLSVSGKKGKLLVCQDRECGYRKTVAQFSNARCPQCHKKMLLHGDGEKRRFQCECGYRELLSQFEKRKQSTAGLQKKDVQKYMKKINQEAAPKNNLLADALKDFHIE